MKTRGTILSVFFLLMVSQLFAQADFYDQVNYKGAFGSTDWTYGWTALYQYGVTADAATASDVVDVTADITGTEFWTADHTYLLHGRIFVNENAVLNIEAGTVVKGAPGTGENASALIVARGGKIYAEGTADRPIIFTAEADDVTDPADITYTQNGQWGGVILLGRASINRPGGEWNIEGIPTTEPRGMYGGQNDDDNSGVLRYISIRHGGAEIGEGNEINGLTFGGVGRGTTIEHIEVFSNFDDGYEWFGGTVNCKYLIAAFCGDDCFDFDEGFRGKLQFLFAIQHSDFGNRCGEHDGAPSSAVTTEPKAYPVIYNATYLGSGKNSTNGDQDELFKMRENFGGEYNNSIFGDYHGFGVSIENKYSPNDAADRLAAGELKLQNNIWFDCNGYTIADSVGKEDYTQAYLQDAAHGNTDSDPMLMGISRAQDGGLDPRPATNSPAWDNLHEIPFDGFFDQVDYKGAFGATDWTYGWTALYQYGVTADAATASDVVDVTADITGTEFWTADHTYLLNGRIFVNDGGVLHIEAGTVVKGAPGTGENASALIVARGGRLYAEGTGNRPIIFTAQADDVTDPADITYTQNGQWGGVILLGKAGINRPGGEWNIEGIPTTEPRGMYGGTDDNDVSGLLQYVSIRHGGAEIGEGNEINGLTFGGVGSGTTIDHIEVFSNFDDGYEWFGGTVHVKYLIAAFCGDDCFDFDEGFRGKLQFLFALQHSDFGNRCGEHDGAPSSAVTTEPKAYPVIYNATYLGSGKNSTNGDQDELFKMRENFGGEYNNSIFGDYHGFGVSIENKYSPNDAADRLAAGELKLQNNIWFDCNGYTIADSVGKEDYTQAYLQDAAHGNTDSDPMLMGISRAQDGGLDPRPSTTGPAWDNLLEYPTTGVVENDFVNSGIPTKYILSQNYPNPFNPQTTIRFSLPAAGRATLAVYNMLGQQVAILIDGFKPSGTHEVVWDATNLSSGMYIYQLRTGNQVISKKMLLLK